MSASKDSTFVPTWDCAAIHDRPCRRQVPVEGAVCAFCMYDGHVGAAYPKKGTARELAEQSLKRCYKNGGTTFAGLCAKKLLADQGKPKKEGKA